MKSRVKFVIASPSQRWGGGPIALHALCRNLQEAGYNAKILLYDYGENDIFRYSNDVAVSINIVAFIKCLLKELWIAFFRFLNSILGTKLFEEYTIRSVKGIRHYLRTCVDDNTVVVYPESLNGNPLQAKNVVHWLLYYYDPPEGGYGKSDLFIAYREQFNNEKLNPEGYTASVSHFDLDLYKRTNFGEREGNCYIIRKGARDRNDVPEEFDGPIIDNMPEREKVKCFNKCKYCISYDLQTAYSSIAAICGCISIVVPEPGKSKSDYRKPNDNTDGIAYGFGEDEIAHAIATRDNVLKRYEAVNERGKQNAKRFAEICVKHFFAEKTDINKEIDK